MFCRARRACAPSHQVDATAADLDLRRPELAAALVGGFQDTLAIDDPDVVGRYARAAGIDDRHETDLRAVGIVVEADDVVDRRTIEDLRPGRGRLVRIAMLDLDAGEATGDVR